MENMFNRDVVCNMDVHEMNTIRNEIKDLLENYSYNVTDDGIDTIVQEWRKNKGWLIELMKKSPYYVDGKYMIVLNEEYNREINFYDVHNFAKFLYESFSFREITDKHRYVIEFLEDMESLENVQFIGEKTACRVNEVFDSIHAHSGQKTSRVLNKIFKEIGLAEKDGYDKEFARLADAINPLKVIRHTIISVNPVDYYTMSFGNSWASCHTIDKNNTRNSSNNYSGCYSSGTESYMLDGSSIIVYIVDNSYDGIDFEVQDKIKRCVFCLGDNEILQSRVYPDGRDGGDRSISAQLRTIVQRVFSELCGVPNLWVNKKGTDACEKATESDGTHYKDYLNYDDCNVSFHKSIADNRRGIIRIGHNPICPYCGRTHYENENILCDDCSEIGFCRNCGRRIRNDDYQIETYDGNMYCCESCAMEDGYVYCENTNRWVLSDDDGVYVDHLTKGYFEFDFNSVKTEDSKYYMSETNATEDGYLRAESNGKWYPADEVEVSSYSGNSFRRTEGTIYTSDGNVFENDWEASESGYVYDSDSDEWIEDATVSNGKIKVGDFVTGNELSRSHYFLTTDESLMKVTNVYSKTLSVIIFATSSEKNNTYGILNTCDVWKKYIVKTTPEDYFSKHPNALMVNEKWREVNGRQ